MRSEPGPRRGERCGCLGGAAASAFACCRYLHDLPEARNKLLQSVARSADFKYSVARSVKENVWMRCAKYKALL